MNILEKTIEELYKNESGRLLAVLTRIFGTNNFDLVEDVLQDAFGKALVNWRKDGIPDNTTAWLVRTARNKAIDTIRLNRNKVKFSEDLSHHLKSEWSLGATLDREFQEHHIKDDQLRMIFACCHEKIKPSNRIPFILKYLCGFKVRAIARALLIPEVTVKKRLLRTKEQLKGNAFEIPHSDKIVYAMDTVHTVLYLLFNEGFYSSDDKKATNFIFCQEAIGLTALLIEDSRIFNQDTLALFALMHFHMARADTRTDDEGFNIPIDLQDRSLWNGQYISAANSVLNSARYAAPGASGRFQIEALIAKEHCGAAAFRETNWGKIAKYYERLVGITNSDMARLNQAIAIGYAGDLSDAIEQVVLLQEQESLKHSHLPLAALAHLHAKSGNGELAYIFALQSKKRGGTPFEQRTMMLQIERLLEKG